MWNPQLIANVIDSDSCVESDSDLMNHCVVVMDICHHYLYHHKALKPLSLSKCSTASIHTVQNLREY